MGCNTFMTKEDDAKIEASARGENTGIKTVPKEILDRVMPAVEKALEQRVVECLKENTEKAMKDLNGKLVGREPTDLEKLDSKIQPTEKEYREMYKVGKELGLKEWHIVNMPAITGIDPKTGKHLENMEKNIKEVMTILHTSKILPEHREEYVINKIMFVKQQRATGKKEGTLTIANVLSPERLKAKPELPRTMHIYLNEKGEFPKKEDLKGILAHEIFHVNEDRFMKQIEKHEEEWRRVIMGKEGILSFIPVISKHAGTIIDRWINGEIEAWQRDRELIPDYYAVYSMTDKCPEEISAFFEKYLSE